MRKAKETGFCFALDITGHLLMLPTEATCC